MTTTEYIPARRYMGASRTHSKTSYLRLQYGDWVQIIKLNERTAVVAPMTNTQGRRVDPQFSYKFTVKLADLRES